MNNESKIALINHLQSDEYNNKTVEEAHTYFHSPRIVSVTTQQLKQVTTSMLFSVLSQSSVSNIIKWNNLGLIIENIKDQNRQGIGMLIQGLALASEITPTEAAAGLAILEETESITSETIQDAPIVRVLYGIKDPGRPNAIPLNEFTECFNEARL